MSLYLRTLCLLMLRNSKALTSSYSLTQVTRIQPICCRLRDIKVYTQVNHLGNSAVQFQGRESSDTIVDEVESKEGLTLSDSCVNQLLKVTEKEPDLFLRVMVAGGGCSGFQYKIDFDTKVNTDDRVFERGGVRVVVDELSLELVRGCTVDYHTELIRSGFKITGNPKADTSCSCGVSFAPK